MITARKTGLLLLVAAASGLVFASGARAGSRDKKIRRLEKKLKELQRTMRRAMEFRAKYATLRADSSFLDRLLRQDMGLLSRFQHRLNDPVTMDDAFLSWVKKNPAKARRERGRYSSLSTYLWLSCRFGLKAVKARQYYTIRIDIVDARSGVRIFQSLKPLQRRISKMRDSIVVPIGGLRIAEGSYKMRVVVEVGTGSARKTLRFRYRRLRRHRPLPRP